MNGRMYYWICLGLVFVAATGCSGGAQEEAEDVLNAVRGVVRLNGKPAPAGTIVTLIPKDGSQASEQISGVYSSEEDVYGIMTVRNGESFAGAPEGEYTVIVQPPKNKPGSIPAKYGNPATSGLTMEVKSGINNPPEINLTR